MGELQLEGNPGVLVVDDEEIMRDVTSIILEDYGAKVFLAEDGEKALEVFASNLDDIEVVCLDFSMPALNGYQVFKAMKEQKSDFVCVFISGLNVTPEVQELVDQGEVKFLSKPFREKELIEAISALRQK
jgi:CheY-like chemotaxis protein